MNTFNPLNPSIPEYCTKWSMCSEITWTLSYAKCPFACLFVWLSVCDFSVYWVSTKWSMCSDISLTLSYAKCPFVRLSVCDFSVYWATYAAKKGICTRCSKRWKYEIFYIVMYFYEKWYRNNLSGVKQGQTWLAGGQMRQTIAFQAAQHAY